MSVPSANSATTCEKPNFETERTSSSPLRPPRAYSTGKVMSRSTSSGASSGATVLTWTCTGVVSGKASSGRRRAASSPRTISRPARSRTTNRFFKLNPIRASSIVGPPRWPRRSVAAAGADAAAGDLGREQEGAIGDGLLARSQAPGDLDDIAPAGRPGQDPLRPVASPLLRQEHEVGPILALQGRPGGHDGVVLGPALDLGPPDLVGAEPALGVGQLGADARGAGRGIDLGPDPGDPAREGRRLGARIDPGDREGHRLARAHGGDVPLVDVDPEPHPGRVGDGVQPAGRHDRLALDG